MTGNIFEELQEKKKHLVSLADSYDMEGLE